MACPREKDILYNLRGPELEEPLRVFCVFPFYTWANCGLRGREECLWSKSSQHLSSWARTSSQLFWVSIPGTQISPTEHYKIIFLYSLFHMSLHRVFWVSGTWNFKFQIFIHSTDIYWTNSECWAQQQTLQRAPSWGSLLGVFAWGSAAFSNSAQWWHGLWAFPTFSLVTD